MLPFYIANFEGGGYAVISADKRTDVQLLAYSQNNTFDLSADAEYPTGLQIWLHYTKSEIEEIRELAIDRPIVRPPDGLEPDIDNCKIAVLPGGTSCCNQAVVHL
ncbi:MAG: Spi family protease inhibitor [Prevotellaceae bacterium]|nr:Spi family protease inhibitor [Prevotellaceae bacterium]